jgi:hypothetical protein
MHNRYLRLSLSELSTASIDSSIHLCAVLQQGQATGVHLVGTGLVGQLLLQCRAEAVRALNQGLRTRYGTPSMLRCSRVAAGSG